MSCFLSSCSQNLPVDFWNHISIDYTHDTNLCISKNFNYIENNVGHGLMININEMIFIITCHHIIGDNNINNIIYFLDANSTLAHQNATLVMQLKELDIAILKPENPENIDISLTFSINDLYPMIDPTIKQGYINYIENEVKQNFMKTNIAINSIENVPFVSSIITDLIFPCYKIKVPDKIINDLSGLSGSPVMTNNIPLGIIMSCDNDQTITVLPYCLIANIIKSSLLIGRFTLNSIIMDTQMCSIIFENESDIIDTQYKVKDQILGNYIKNSYEITYKKQHSLKLFKFKNYDVILKINKNPFLNNGYIYDPEIKYNIYYKTYFMLSSYKTNFVHLEILRNNKIENIYIKGANIPQNLTLNLGKTQSWINYHGLIFTELTDTLLQYFKINNVKMNDNYQKINNDKINKYIALVHIDMKFIKNHYNKGVSELKKMSFPYPNKSLLIINKIGNEIISDILSLCKILRRKSNEKKKTFNFYTSNPTQNLIIESDNSIIQLKF